MENKKEKCRRTDDEENQRKIGNYDTKGVCEIRKDSRNIIHICIKEDFSYVRRCILKQNCMQ